MFVKDWLAVSFEKKRKAYFICSTFPRAAGGAWHVTVCGVASEVKNCPLPLTAITGG